MIHVFDRISVRHLARHKLRTALTVFGAALGVAAMVGIRLVNETASRSFERSINALAGRTVLQITNGDLGVPEGLLDELKALPGMGPSAATVHGFVGLPDWAGERLYVLGIDLLADQQLRDYSAAGSAATVEDPLLFLAQADSIALTSRFMKERGLTEGGVMRVQAPTGIRTLTVRATIDVTSGPAVLFAGRLAVMDVLAAQRLFGVEGRFTEIDLGAPAGSTTLPEAAIAAVVGERATVEHPQRRAETLERLLAGNRLVFTIGAVLANVLGLYLVFNSMMIAVAQRKREMAILRSLGMRRRQVVWMIVLEGFALGGVACVLGIPLGLALARAIWAPYAASVSNRFLQVDAVGIGLQLKPVLWAVTVGLLVAVLAAVLPAWEGSRVRPMESLRPPAQGRTPPAPLYRRMFLVGTGLVIARLLLPVLHAALPGLPLTTAHQLGDVASLLAVSLMAPTLVRVVAERVEWVLGRSLGPLLAVASRNVVANVPRVSVTAAALLVSLAGAIGIASIAFGFQRSFNQVFKGEFSHLDLAISGGSQFIGPSATPLPGALARQIADLPGVAVVDASRWLKVPCDGLVTYLIARDAAIYRDDVRVLTLVRGDRDDLLRKFARGDAVFVSEVFARRFGKQLGDVVTLKAPGGPVSLEIAGVYADLNDLGAIYIDRTLYRRLWNDDSVTFIEFGLRPGVDPDRVMGEIRRRWGTEYELFIVKVADLRDEFQKIADQAFFAAYPLVAIALVISLLGLINAIVASLIDRTRHVGVMRAIGMTRRQLIGSIVLEAAIVGLAGGVFGILAGSVLGYFWVEQMPYTLGVTFAYRYPTSVVAFALVASLVLACGAGLVASRAATRLDLRRALQYE